MEIVKCVLFAILLFIYCFYEGDTQKRLLEAIPERFEKVFVNDKYLANITSNVRRKDRRSGYTFNLSGYIKYAGDNNVSVHIVYFEFLHNEYKRSFVEMHFKLCDLINKDPYVGMIVRQTGIVCPLPAGYYNVSLKLTIPNFPYEFPFKKCMVEIVFKTEPAHELVFKGKLYLTYRQNLMNYTKSV